MEIYAAWQGVNFNGAIAIGSTTFKNVKDWKTRKMIRAIESEIARLNGLQVVSLTNFIELTDEAAR